MDMTKVKNSNGVDIFVCKSCIDGEHISYGHDHRDGDRHHNDCKNMGLSKEFGSIQCCCEAGQKEEE